jgi:CheY-like chemotaxis protein
MARRDNSAMSLVLVADDEPAVLEVLSQVVEDLGHEVIQARDGEEAWSLARARRPQLVVTDHMMPRLSGQDLCRRLKGDTELREVPILLLSAVLPQGTPEAYAFLNKPFEITEFEGLVRKALEEAPRPKPVDAATSVAALGEWVARGFEGPLATAREQLRRLEAGAPAERAVLESLGAQLQAMESLAQQVRDAARREHLLPGTG